MLELQDALRQFSQRSELVGGKDLPLDDREVDLDLIEPAGVEGSVNQNQMGVLGAESLDSLHTSMRRTIVDDPEDSPCVAVGTPSHDVGDEAVKGRDTVPAFAATEDSGTVDIQGGEVSPGPEPLVLVLDSHRQTGLCIPGRMFPGARLDAGLLVRADHEFVCPEPTALPDALVEVQDPPGFVLEVRVSGKDPAAMLPRTDGILVEPSPDGGVADGRGQAGGTDVGAEFSHTPARKGRPNDARELAGDRLNLHDQFGGERPEGDRGVGGPQDRPDALRRSAFATS